MDELKLAGFSTTGVAIILILYRVFKTLQGKRLVSSCCGHSGSVGFQVENMTPKHDEVIVMVENPVGLKSSTETKE
jgi:hypothetical protein